MIDPYAKKLIGRLIWHKAIFGYDVDSPDKDLSFSTLDSAPYVPKSVVVGPNQFDWEGDVPPQVDPAKTIFYEAQNSKDDSVAGTAKAILPNQLLPVSGVGEITKGNVEVKIKANEYNIQKIS